MTGRGNIRRYLINAEHRHVVFLTLAFFLTLISHFSHADSPYLIDSEENKRRISEVENYIRQQAKGSVGLLPGEVRTAIGWASGSWHAVALSDSEEASGPIEPLTSSAVSETGGDVPFHLASNFHHKGFLPTHDAMMMGFDVGKNVFDNKMQLTVRPFYGQGWRSLQGYWGSEVTMNILERDDGMPHGKISMGYVDGNESMTDNGRGIELHGDVDLTNRWTFTSGIKQDNVSGDTNYVMVKWKLDFQ